MAMPTEPSASRSIFGRWERLRLAYNGILLVVVVATAWSSDDILQLVDPGFVRYAALRCLIANVLFIAGPVGEICAVKLIGPTSRPTGLIFGLGCLISCPLAAYSTFIYPLTTLLGKD